MTIENHINPYVRAASAGIATGMRGSIVLAAIALAAQRGTLDIGDDRLGRMLRSRPTQTLLALAAAGELVVDKLPMTPSRLQLGPLVGRTVWGGVSGAIVSRSRAGCPATGAVIGAVAAIVSSWVFGRGRARIGSITGLPDPIVAVGEDALAIVFAALATGAVPTDD